MDEIIRALIGKELETEEGRRRLVESMMSPKRCGGLDYIDGKPFYRVGGRLLTPEEYKAL